MNARKEEEALEEIRGQVQEAAQPTLLKELCGGDDDLYGLLSFYLYANPVAALSNKPLDVLVTEAEESGNFRPALDKAIFEGSQHLGERERYVSIIQDLSSKSQSATEQAKKQQEQQGFTERAASLGKRLEEQKLMSERAGDILDVAAKFYGETLLEREQDARRIVRDEARRESDKETRRIGEQEETGRDARRQARRKMGWKERREAKKRDKIENLAAREREQAREEARKRTEEEERRIEEHEKTGRDARREKRSND